MDVNSTAATLYSSFMLELERAVAGDEAKRDGLEWNPLGPERLMRLLAGGLDESWWNDVGASSTQTRAEILDRVLGELDTAGARQRWGDLHQVGFDHPLAGFPIIGQQVSDSWSRGPFAVSGDGVTVNAQAWSERRPFAVTSIPAMRFVTEVGNWDDTVLVLPLGQSGRPWSSHYSDQISSWMHLETVRFPFSREAVERSATASLELLPAPEKQPVAEGGR
jgi:penicillin amidase